MKSTAADGLGREDDLPGADLVKIVGKAHIPFLLDFMEKIVHKIPLDDGLTLDEAGREAVVRAIRADKRSSGLSIRKLVRSMNLAATGVENWEELVALYC